MVIVIRTFSWITLPGGVGGGGEGGGEGGGSTHGMAPCIATSQVSLPATVVQRACVVFMHASWQQYSS